MRTLKFISLFLFILILLLVFGCQKEVIIEVPEEKSEETSEKLSETKPSPTPISI